MADWGRTGIAWLVGVLLLSFLFSFAVVPVEAQTGKTFTPQDVFSAPDVNGSLHFAVNGSYATVTFQDGFWTFRELLLNNSRSAINISISTVNCDMKVFSLSASNTSSGRFSIRYTISGTGTQTVQFLDIQSQTRAYEWSVIVPGTSGGAVWLSEGVNWNLLPENTVTVNGIVGNVTISRYNFVSSQVDSNLPFHMQHSVLIVTIGVLIAVVSAALVFKLARRK